MKIQTRRNSDGFTLIEIMIVVVIIGILAATILPQFIGQSKTAKINAAKGSVQTLQSAVELFNVNLDRYPTMEEGLEVLMTMPADGEGKWRGPYLKKMELDPWGHPYQYKVPGTHHPASFDLWSRGADGADGGEGDDADIGNW
jgi:general secretion pathway protein G